MRYIILNEHAVLYTRMISHIWVWLIRSFLCVLCMLYSMLEDNKEGVDLSELVSLGCVCDSALNEVNPENILYTIIIHIYTTQVHLYAPMYLITMADKDLYAYIFVNAYTIYVFHRSTITSSQITSSRATLRPPILCSWYVHSLIAI